MAVGIYLICQVVIDNTGEIRHIECGFLGHQNDAQQFRLMRQIGQDLPFPRSFELSAFSLPPIRFPVYLSLCERDIYGMAVGIYLIS
jgi:hypothetical protein